MKRRGFISLASAALTAPLLPRPVFAAPAAAAGGNGLYHYALAVFHARMRQAIGPDDLCKLMKLTPAQSHQMLARLIADRHIIHGALPGTYTAANPYVQNPALHKLAKLRGAERRSDKQHPECATLFAHVRQIAHAYFATKRRATA